MKDHFSSQFFKSKCWQNLCYLSCSFLNEEGHGKYLAKLFQPGWMLWGTLFLLPLSIFVFSLFSFLSLNLSSRSFLEDEVIFLANYKRLCLCILIFRAENFHSIKIPIPRCFIFQLSDSFSLVLLSFDVHHQLNVIMYVGCFLLSAGGSGSLIPLTINCSHHL